MKQRVISTPALLFASISAIIGSGWLFAAYYAAITTGPASLVAWLIGSIAMIIVAFTFAELSAFLPVTGATIRAPHYTHGRLVSLIFAWIIWATYFSLMSVEVQAIIQYGSFFYPDLVYSNGGLTHSGYYVATCLMLLVSAVNFYSLKWLLRCNNFLTILKIVIPLILAGAIIVHQFPITHASITQMTFFPTGLKGILAALATSGIIFSFNGFRQATEMAGEVKNPQVALPVAIIGSILVCMIIYVALQYSFLAAIFNNQHLAEWQNLKFSGSNSPFSIVLRQQKLDYLLPVLYLGAIIGPFAAALMYCSSGARALYAMSQNGSLPKIFAHVTPQGSPLVAISLNFVMAMLLFMPFPGWASMASFLTSLMVLTYIVAPICLLVLRKQMPDSKRAFKIPGINLWVFFSFYICSLLIYWTGWQVLFKLFIVLIGGLSLLICYRFASADRKEVFDLDWLASSWVWSFFIGVGLISYYGSFGGKGVITFGMDFIALAIVSFITLWLGKRFSLPKDKIVKEINSLISGG